jgi:hypothetical protein
MSNQKLTYYTRDKDYYKPRTANSNFSTKHILGVIHPIPIHSGPPCNSHIPDLKLTS